MSTQIKILGKLQITDANGSPADLQNSYKGCALLTYLLVTGQTHSREHISDLLWDASSTGLALQNLRKLLSRVKKSIPGLVVTRKALGFEPDPAVSIDYLKLLSALTNDTPEGVDEGLKLYRGDLLDEFFLPDAPRFNEWLILERERLRRRVTAAYRTLCAAYTDTQNWSTGVDAARRWLAIDELDEEPLRQLMQMRVAEGNATAALERYEFARQRLWEELEVDPEPSTVDLAEQIQAMLEQSRAEMRLPEASSTPTAWPDPDTLPEPGPLPLRSLIPYHRNVDFTGREEALIRLADRFFQATEADDSLPKAAALTGMGGVGKTQLAVEFCYRYGRYFPGGIYWMSFANPENVAEEIASLGGQGGMGLFRDSDQLTVQERARMVTQAWQDPQPKLLIFDNCEDEALFAEWQPVSGGSRILLTSQRGHWSPELNVYQLPVAPLALAESVALLGTLFPDLEPAIAAEISEEIGNLPLALHLAGNFLRRYRQIAPENYLTQLRQRGILAHPSLQGRGTRYSPTDHHLSVARTFAINIEQLDPADEIDQLSQQLLLHAALFMAGEPIPQRLLLSTVLADEADTLDWIDAEDGLMRLTTLGLLEREGGESVVMHRLVAEFTLEQADESEAGFRTVIQKMAATIGQKFTRTSYMGDMSLSANHLSAVVSRALDQELIDVLQLIPMWTRHLRDNADYDQALRVSLQALELCEKKLEPNHPDTARVHFAIGVVYLQQGLYRAAQAQLTRSLAIREAILPEDDPDLAQSYNSLGILLLNMGEYDEARPLLEKTLSSWRQALGVSDSRVAIAMNNLGLLLVETGEFDHARSYIEQALTIWEETNGREHPLTAHGIHNKGVLFLNTGDDAAAQRQFEEALHIRRTQLGPKHPSTAQSLHFLGRVSMNLGDYEEAREHLLETLSILEEAYHEDHPSLGRVHLFLRELYRLLEQPELAEQHEDQVAKIFQKAGIALYPSF